MVHLLGHLRHLIDHVDGGRKAGQRHLTRDGPRVTGPFVEVGDPSTDLLRRQQVCHIFNLVRGKGGKAKDGKAKDGKAKVRGSRSLRGEAKPRTLALRARSSSRSAWPEARPGGGLPVRVERVVETEKPGSFKRLTCRDEASVVASVAVPAWSVGLGTVVGGRNLDVERRKEPGDLVSRRLREKPRITSGRPSLMPWQPGDVIRAPS
jgi:hypothetical protein